MNIKFKDYKDSIAGGNFYTEQGKVIEVIGNVIRAYNIGLEIGALCEIFSENQAIPAEVVGFKDNSVYVMPLGEIRGLGASSFIRKLDIKAQVPVGPGLLGRVIDGNLQPIDGKGPLQTTEQIPIFNAPPNPMQRKRITEPLDVGVKAINGLLTIGKGQRIAILAGSGVGKSVLLGMMGRHTKAQVNVIGLIGERGREIKEFIERDLGPEGLKKSVIITATSDQPPLLRIRAAHIATSIAEYFREQGSDVLLMMDSLTRFAMAIREIGLSIGEPPTTKGYPPSVYTQFPKLLERAGNSASKGSISSFYTVLIEGDDPNDPIGDLVRSIVDGHIVLDRNIASKGNYPAIDILNSKSRLMLDIVKPEHLQVALKFVQNLAVYRDAEDLINIGAYVQGSNPKIDYALSKIDHLQAFINQPLEQDAGIDASVAMMQKILK